MQNKNKTKMQCYGRCCWAADRERGRGRWLLRATVPAVLQYRGYCSQEEGCEGKRAAARVGGAGDAGRGASPTAGKREGISF